MSEDPTPDAFASIELKQLELWKKLSEAKQSCREIQLQIDALRLQQPDEKETSEGAPQVHAPLEPKSPTPPPLPQAAKHTPSPAPKPPSASPIPKPQTSDLELKIGQTWFVRIGLLSLLTGLIFLSNYAYKNWLFGAPAEVKAGFFFGVSLLLSFSGLAFEKRKEKLKLYGRALTAGGLATGYYTIYAAHFTESLHCIQSPILAGLLLTMWAGVMLGYAVWKRSQIISILATSLAFYGTIVNPADWLSLFSALILSVSGMFLFIRYRWTSVGFTTVIGAYLSHAFWLGFYPQEVSPLLHYSYLACYWATFTTALVTYVSRSEPNQKSGYLAAINNGALWALTCFSLPHLTPIDHFGIVTAVIGVVLLAAAALTRWKKLPTLPSVFLYQGLFLVTLSILTEFSGPYRFIVLGAEAVLLLGAAYRSKSPYLLIAAGLTYLLSLISGAASLELPIFQQPPSWQSYAVLFLLSSAFTSGVRYIKNKQPNRAIFSPLIPALLSYLVLTFGVLQQLPNNYTLAISSLIFASIWGLYLSSNNKEWTRDIATFAPLAAATTTMLPILGSYAIDSQELAFCIPLALTLFWWTSKSISELIHSNTQLIPQSIWEDKRDPASWVFASLVAISLYLTLTPHLSNTTWIYLGAALALGGSAVGRFTKRISITMAAQSFHLLSLGTLITYSFYNSPNHLWVAPLLIAVQIVLSDSFLKMEWSAGLRNFLGVLLTLQLCIAYPDHPLILSLIAIPCYLWAIRLRSHAFMVCGPYFLLLLSSLLAYDSQPHWLILKYLPMLIGLTLYALTKFKESDTKKGCAVFQSTGKFIIVTLLVASASADTLEHFHGNGLSVCWALLAISLLSAGLSLKDRCYRLSGLLLFAMTICHVMFVDVMALNTLGRILSFIALGLTLIATGYLYNRFSERIRQFL